MLIQIKFKKTQKNLKLFINLKINNYFNKVEISNYISLKTKILQMLIF